MQLQDVLNVLGCTCIRRRKTRPNAWKPSDDDSELAFVLPNQDGQAAHSPNRGLRGIGSTLNPFAKKVTPTTAPENLLQDNGGIYSIGGSPAASTSFISAKDLEEIDLTEMIPYAADDLDYNKSRYGSSRNSMPRPIPPIRPKVVKPLPIQPSTFHKAPTKPEGVMKGNNALPTIVVEDTDAVNNSLTTQSSQSKKAPPQKSETGDDRDSLPSQKDRSQKHPKSQSSNSLSRGQRVSQRPASISSHASSSSIKRKPVGSGYSPLIQE